MRGNEERRDIPFTKYRSLQGNLVFWAKQMPDAFEIQYKTGLVDQRKAGAKHRVQYVQTLKGKAGDYLVITDMATGMRNVFSREAFEKHFVRINQEIGEGPSTSEL
jgi:hypothetical protein